MHSKRVIKYWNKLALFYMAEMSYDNVTMHLPCWKGAIMGTTIPLRRHEDIEIIKQYYLSKEQYRNYALFVVRILPKSCQCRK